MADQSSKGNPASHRMSNPNLKARRARSWLAGERRKEARRKAQAEREARNKELREAGKPTPWEAAKAARKARRANDRKEIA